MNLVAKFSFPVIVCLNILFANPMQSQWQPDSETIKQANEIRSGFIYTEDEVPDYQLPKVLRNESGEDIESPEAWLEHRPTLLNIFRDQVYGHSPGPPDKVVPTILEKNPQAMKGAATLKRVQITCVSGEKSHAFELILFIPNKRKQPAPAFLLINNRGPENTDPTRENKSEFWPAEALIERGYAAMAFQNKEVAPDDPDHFREGVIRLFEDEEKSTQRPPHAWGALAAWAWGASRVMDYLEKDEDIDSDRVTVIGHSRGGKASLWAGAEDERFSIVISNNSGCGGAALSRRKFGETLAWINKRFPHWFAENFNQYNNEESSLPVDQHMLIALIAPRGVYVASAGNDLWADPRGEFLSLAHASPVYELWDADAIDPHKMPRLESPLTTSKQGYHIRNGGHNLTLYDWHRYMDFADQYYSASDKNASK